MNESEVKEEEEREERQLKLFYAREGKIRAL
jgi:hypothetical protein